MPSDFGKMIHVSVFGESHGPAIGAVIDGLPPGEAVDTDRLAAFMKRRRPGQGSLTTARREEDLPVFLSGIKDGILEGTPVAFMIENADMHSGDYAALRDCPRPGHADWPAAVRYRGFADMRGGGHFSGRLTAPICAAGGLALQILRRKNILIGAHLSSAAGIRDALFPLRPDAALFDRIAETGFPVIDPAAGEKMKEKIEESRKEGDSVGGTVECAAVGLPAGLGGPLFSGVESRLAEVFFGIPAVKGVEFGEGFAAAEKKGSEMNDPYCLSGKEIQTSSNHSGGLLGGITTGMPVIARLCFKPTPSISKPQQTVDLAAEKETAIEIKGRHDPCVALRAVPVAEAAMALVLLDLLLEEKGYGYFGNP